MELIHGYRPLQSAILGHLGEVTYKGTQYQLLSLKDDGPGRPRRNFGQEYKRLEKKNILLYEVIDGDTYVFIFPHGTFRSDVPPDLMKPGSEDFIKIRVEAGEAYGEEWGKDPLT